MIRLIMLLSTPFFVSWLSITALARAHTFDPSHAPTRLHQLPKDTSESIRPSETKKFERMTREPLKPPQAFPLPDALPVEQRHIPSVHSSTLNTSIIHRPISVPPVTCFNPYATGIAYAKAEDCLVIIHHIILSYPNPMQPETFGYNDDVDVDLRERVNAAWDYGKCVAFVRNERKTRVDTFRMADVAAAANRITDECIMGQRYAVGGSTDVGSEGFYVGLGGYPRTSAKSER